MSGARVLILLGLVVWAVSWFVSPYIGLGEVGGFVSGAKKAVEEIGNTIGGKHPPKTPSEGAAKGLGETFGESTRGADALAAGGPPGWIAFRMTWDGLTDGDTWSNVGKDARPAVLSLTCLTNGLMVIALLAFLVSRGGRGFGLMLLLCAILDAAWIYLNDEEFRHGIQAGYWMWLGSFVVAGLGFVGGRRKSAV